MKETDSTFFTFLQRENKNLFCDDAIVFLEIEVIYSIKNTGLHYRCFISRK